MTVEVALLSILLGLLVNECTDAAPWCARKLVQWSAFCKYANQARAQARAEELAALINDRPGNLFKLITALGFVFGAVITATHRKVAERKVPVAHEVPCSTVLDLVYSYLEGEVDQATYAQIQVHLSECGPCLREYGLEEVVKRLVHRHCEHNVVPSDLLAKVLDRIEAIRTQIEAVS